MEHTADDSALFGIRRSTRGDTHEFRRCRVDGVDHGRASHVKIDVQHVSDARASRFGHDVEGKRWQVPAVCGQDTHQVIVAERNMLS
jgi:hypothetical protein